ncbi:MAG TPA: hypothetical protein VMV48_07635 [Gallionellaceae bacterium]|nr:hypothetical protein [Gallionellaceae bacterium]
MLVSVPAFASDIGNFSAAVLIEYLAVKSVLAVTQETEVFGVGNRILTEPAYNNEIGEKQTSQIGISDSSYGLFP